MKVGTRHWKRWLVMGGGAVLLAVVGGPWVYFNLVAAEAPAPLGLPSLDPTAQSAVEAQIEGTWTIASDSQAGYRVKEILFGQSAEAVGRTDAITGTASVSGAVVRSATFTVDMATVTSDQSRRDNQFRGRIMEVERFPTASFTLTKPIALGTVPSEGEQRTAEATGRPHAPRRHEDRNVRLTGRYTGSSIQVSGSIPVVFADYGVQDPSFGPAQTEDDGVLEFALTLTHA